MIYNFEKTKWGVMRIKIKNDEFNIFLKISSNNLIDA